MMTKKFDFKLCHGLRDIDKLAVCEIFAICDKDFIPAISMRDGMTGFRTDCSLTEEERLARVHEYVDILSDCEFLLVYDGDDGDKLVGLMAWRENLMPEMLQFKFIDKSITPVYINSIAVLPEYRRMGITRRLYNAVIDLHMGLSIPPVFTLRTWGCHDGHINLLNQIGFCQACRLMNHRGPGIDTVYFVLEV